MSEKLVKCPRCGQMVPEYMLGKCTVKLPTNLKELVELAKKPPKHKRMRRWKCP